MKKTKSDKGLVGAVVFMTCLVFALLFSMFVLAGRVASLDTGIANSNENIIDNRIGILSISCDDSVYTACKQLCDNYDFEPGCIKLKYLEEKVWMCNSNTGSCYDIARLNIKDYMVTYDEHQDMLYTSVDELIITCEAGNIIDCATLCNEIIRGESISDRDLGCNKLDEIKHALNLEAKK